MTIAIKQLTDTQLTEAGWTTGQIKEVRKYLKVPGDLRNAHQRGLCRRYSDIQRQVFAIKPDARFISPNTKANGTRRSSTKVRWAAEEFDLLISLYLKYVDGTNGVENRDLIVENFQRVYPDRSASAVALGVCQIKGLDAYHPANGMKDTSALLISKLVAVDPNRFAA
jgi:hypothetical protein